MISLRPNVSMTSDCKHLFRYDRKAIAEWCDSNIGIRNLDWSICSKPKLA